MKGLGVVVVFAGCAGVHTDVKDRPVVWETAGVSLQAVSFTAVVEGVTFHGVADPIYDDPSRGDLLQFDWTENGYTQRFWLGFDLVESGWVVDGIRIYNLAGNEWHEGGSAIGNIGAAMGESYRGDIVRTWQTGARIEIKDAIVQPFLVP